MVTTLNPAQTTASGVLSNGDLTLTTSVSSYQNSISTTSKSSGKVYYEVTVNNVGGIGAFGMGLAQTLPIASHIVGEDGACSFLGGHPHFNYITKSIY